MNSIKSIGLEELNETIFIKDFSRDNINLKNLENLLNSSDDMDLTNKLKKDIHLIKQGLEGENNVYFELKNSLLPMVCLHDVRIRTGQNYAQIDFLVITNKFICIMETKNLVGDITITKDGDFIREIRYKDNTVREGMYSPITQGCRHARILKKALLDSGIVESKSFPIFHIAVMANHKSIINRDDAPESVRNYIYRCDQIVNFLEKELYSNKYGVILSDEKILNIGKIIYDMNIPLKLDYESKYGIKSINNDCNKSQCQTSRILPFKNTKDNSINSFSKLKNDIVQNKSESNKVTSNNESIYVSLKPEDNSREKLIKRFKNFRYEKAQERDLKPYEIFTNKEMELIIDRNPKTIPELKDINLRLWVINELGVDILKILNPNLEIKKKTLNTDKELEDSLKKYRFSISNEKNVPIYEVFTNAEMKRIIEAKPKSIDELFEIKGFSNINKIKRYGEGIINIIKG